MWVVDWVHDNTTDGWANALPTHTTGLAPADVHLVSVADLTHGCAATNVNAADFGRWHTQDCVLAFLTQQLDRRTSGTCKFCTSAWLQLHGVDDGTGWDVAQWQVVANLDVGGCAGFNDSTLLQALRSDDVALLAIEVVQQSNVCGAVWVVLDVSDLCRNAVLVVTTEVDHAVTTLVATADVAGGDTTVVVTTTSLGNWAQQRLFRGRTSDLFEHGNGALAATRSCRLVLTNSHSYSLPLDFPLRRSRRRCRWSRCPHGESRRRAWWTYGRRNRCGCACACPRG